MRKIMYNGSNLKGTKAYWYTRGLELKDMVVLLSYQLLSDTDN